MPTITYDKQDLLNLIGKKLSDDQLEEVINLIKPSVERIGKDEIVVEHTPDRPDLFGVEGLARAIRCYLEIDRKIKSPTFRKSGLRVICRKVYYRPYIACAVVRNVKLNDYFIKSLMNIQEVLHETVGRKRKKVAIGVHDFDKISFPAEYISVIPETRIVPLESKKEMSLREVLSKNTKGREYGSIVNSNKLWPVYVDSKGVFSFPPIINSDRTKVTNNTKNLFIELTATDRKAVMQALNIMVSNFAERGCTIESVEVRSGSKKEVTPLIKQDIIDLGVGYINEILGLELTSREVLELLKRMGFEAMPRKNKIKVAVPYYRSDILHPVDIVEDIAIAYGYNNFKPEMPEVGTVGKPNDLEKLSSKIRSLIAGLGFQEVVRYVLSSSEKQFGRMNLKNELAVEIENPVSKEYTCLRKYLLPGVLELLSTNMHKDYPQKVFEISDVVYLDANTETGAKNVRKLCCAISDSKVGYEYMSSVVDAYMKNLGIVYTLRSAKHPSFVEGRVAEILIKGKVVGVVGEVSPVVLNNWKIEMPVAAFEIDVNGV